MAALNTFDVLAILPASVADAMQNTDLTARVTVRNRVAVRGHHEQLTGMFTSMVEALELGNPTKAISYINRAGITSDVESILGFSLSPELRIVCGRTCPSHIENITLARACSIARELQALRSAARRTCQQYQLTGNGSVQFHTKLTGFIADCQTALAPWQDYQEDDFEYDCE